MDALLSEANLTAILLTLKLAAVVSGLFAKEGWELVVVGGSAVEFYTEPRSEKSRWFRPNWSLSSACCWRSVPRRTKRLQRLPGR